MDHPRPWWRRVPWWAWCCIGGVVAILVGWIWFVGEWDLRRVEREARAAGLPWTAQELHLDTADPATTAALQKIDLLTRPLSLGYLDRADGCFSPKALATMREQLAANADSVTAIERTVETLPGRPAVIGADLLGRDRIDRFTILQILSARLATCDPAEVDQAMARLVRFSLTVPAQLRGLAASFAASALQTRLGELAGRTDLADALDRLSSNAADGMRSGQVPLFVYLAQAFSAPSRGERICRDLGMSLNDVECAAPRLLLPLEVRGQRAAALSAAIAYLTTMREHPDPATWPAVFPKIEIADSRSAFMRAVLTWQLMPRRMAMVLLRCRLVSAELRRQAWPRDWFDPTGAALRRIERDGRLIGAYSVGYNGVDDLGLRSRDTCWQLYAPLGRKLASDPPPHDP